VKRRTKWALCALLMAATAMAGVAKGGKLYIKGTGVNAYDKAEGTGKKTALKAGDEVTWNGADDKHKEMQAINYGPGGKKKGFVHMANLTPNKPADEVASDGKATTAQAFISSGAGGRGMSQAGLKYAEGGEKAELTAAEIIHLEGSSEDQKKNVADHVKKNGLGGEK
jgi:hypothetical protein